MGSLVRILKIIYKVRCVVFFFRIKELLEILVVFFFYFVFFSGILLYSRDRNVIDFGYINVGSFGLVFGFLDVLWVYLYVNFLIR